MTLIDSDTTRLEDICMAGDDAVMSLVDASCRDKHAAHEGAKQKGEDLHVEVDVVMLSRWRTRRINAV